MVDCPIGQSAIMRVRKPNCGNFCCAASRLDRKVQDILTTVHGWKWKWKWLISEKGGFLRVTETCKLSSFHMVVSVEMQDNRWWWGHHRRGSIANIVNVRAGFWQHRRRSATIPDYPPRLPTIAVGRRLSPTPPDYRRRSPTIANKRNEALPLLRSVMGSLPSVCV